MVQGKWFSPGETLTADVLSVRSSVFGASGNNSDPEAWNTLVYLDDRPVATGRIWWSDNAFWLGGIGVLPPDRGQHLGDLVLRLLLYKAQSHFAREVRLRCPPETEGFFSRLGFQSVSRTPSGHVEMALAGHDISLDSCHHCKKQDCPNRK